MIGPRDTARQRRNRTISLQVRQHTKAVRRIAYDATTAALLRCFLARATGAAAVLAADVRCACMRVRPNNPPMERVARLAPRSVSWVFLGAFGLLRAAQYDMCVCNCAVLLRCAPVDVLVLVMCFSKGFHTPSPFLSLSLAMHSHDDCTVVSCTAFRVVSCVHYTSLSVRLPRTKSFRKCGRGECAFSTNGPRAISRLLRTWGVGSTFFSPFFWLPRCQHHRRQSLPRLSGIGI